MSKPKRKSNLKSRTEVPRIYLAELNQPSRIADLATLPFDRSDHKRIVELRAYSKINRLIAAQKRDFDKVHEIAKFVSRSWSHVDFVPTLKKYDALSILKLAQKGYSFSCAQFATVTVQLCHSVGIPARVLHILTKNSGLGSSGHGHVVMEYFDNQLAKWIWVDPQIHAFARYKGELLSFNEYSELIVEGERPELIFSDRTIEYLKGKKERLKVLANFERRYIWESRVSGWDVFYERQNHKRRTGCKRSGFLPSLTFQGFAHQMPIYLGAVR